MPTIEENLAIWDRDFDWSARGENWSALWGGAAMEWYGTLLPRIHAHVPAPVILELAPGFGRWSVFLKDLCDKLILVDISPKCIDACKARFAREAHVACHVNDGFSLAMVPDDSVDFIFSFDSLVHAESEVMRAYALECGRVLKSNGAGFIHHSNLGGLDNTSAIEKTHLRAPSMSASILCEYLEEAGLCCRSQEIINWGGNDLIDALTLFTGPRSRFSVPAPMRTVNRRFMEEAVYLSTLQKHYGAPLD
ncbi:MAG: class I SAM-dependent methyltransferase [Spartobacteria bacterium]|nr:class I SAM-dependent methyltransferase [Spartobacteria bacterium]